MSATFNGNVLDITGSAAVVPITVRANGDKVITGSGAVVAVGKRHYRSDVDGNFSFALAVGTFYVLFGTGPEIRVVNTHASGTYDFDTIISDTVVQPEEVAPTPAPMRR